MKRYFNEEHFMLRDMVREFAINEIRPKAKEVDSGIFPEENIKKMAELGLMGIPWEEKYGGNGMDTLALVIAIEEIGKECSSTAATMMAHTSLGTGPIVTFGTEEQKEKYLPDLASGKMLGAFGLTEPNAGSDAGNTQTRAVANTDGLRVGEPENKMGWKGSDTRSVYFEDMFIPKENILGNPSKGFKQFLRTLTGGRITIGALALGTAQGAYERALKYSHERKAFGKKINQFQGVSFKIADIATSIQASKHLVYHAAYKKDKGEDVIKEAAMAKLFSSEMCMNVTTEVIQIFGGYGYIKEYDVERFFRDSKILEIGEGTSEVQRIIISREILNNNLL